MKRLVALLLALALSTFAPLAGAADPIPPAEASQHIGDAIVVEGVVSQVHYDKKSGVTFINMGGSYPNHTFTAVIFQDYSASFPGVEAIEGKRISIAGTVELYRSKPQIVLRQTSQLVVE
ncbi:nucleotide-binding protein [Pseudodonghicola flavimaris]|uniref:Nucleotide-binding protein n=1 Tax=Pseudodonghicola flavimaris TaxID=3050036 RepID=A0ABT7EW43_9RHOB|nr:nucleotide-binding protein [Pseudodonghicola flavimaris]MDK3016553.1 nucleotide-binding protein [Pseudodonghicola flavimaris]